MIDREYGKFVLVCDICGEEIDGFDTFVRYEVTTVRKRLIRAEIEITASISTQI